MKQTDLEHLRLVVRLLRLANDTEPVRPDQAAVTELALSAFFKTHDLDEGQALPILEILAFPERDR